MIAQILLGTAFLLSSADEGSDSELAFDFYLNELIEHEMSVDAPMARLIERHLIAATFNTTDGDILKDRLRRLAEAYRDNPDKVDRFKRLDNGFAVAFEKLMKSAKQKRLIYTAAGAAIGAVVAIPISKAISGSSKVLLLAVPLGALAGAGAGFLLGQIMAMPDFEYERGFFSRDLEEIEDFISSQ